MAHPVVDHLLTVHRPFPRPFGPLDVQREGGEISDVMSDAAGDELACPLEELKGGGMGLEVQTLDLGGLRLHAISSQGTQPARALVADQGLTQPGPRDKCWQTLTHGAEPVNEAQLWQVALSKQPSANVDTGRSIRAVKMENYAP